MVIYTFDINKKEELLNQQCKLKQEVKYGDRIAYVFEVNAMLYKKYNEDDSIFLYNKMKFA